MTEAKHCWSLKTARALLGDVRDRTATAFDEVQSLLERLEATAEGSSEYAEVDEQIQAAISRWARSMEAMGLEVKGPWLIDFDNGIGYYCWKWPEEELEHFHEYDEGFDGRIRIQ